MWTANEHERFLEALELYPHGPWKLVAAYIGTRSTRQAMTHAQKYRQKLERRRRGLRNKKSKAQPLDWSPSEMLHVENEPMFSYEQLMTTDTETWRCLEPLPLTAPYPTSRSDTEPAWVDDCFAFFVDSFSC